MSEDDLKAALLAARRASYVRVRGGFPVPLAGMVYWLAVAGLGLYLPPNTQLNLAFWLSGAIFPMALAFAALFGNGFMKEKSAVNSVLAPTFVSMLLFWPMLAAAIVAGAGAGLVLVILAIGMSLHWPVIGWTFGRPFLYGAHSVVRAAVVLALFVWRPTDSFVLIPLAVAAVYLLSVIAIVVDSGRVAGLAATQEPQPA